MTRNLVRQRQRIREAILADPERSSRSIAHEIGCSTTTVSEHRRKLDVRPDGGDWTPDAVQSSNGHSAGSNRGHENLIEPAGPGNGRAVTHGAHSEAQVAPLRAQFLDQLRRRLPAVDPELLVVQAHRQAQLTLLSEWIDQHGIVRSARTGDVFAAAAFAERLASSFERQHDRLREIQREADEAASVIDVDALLDEHRAREDGEHDPEALPARNGTEA